MKTSLSFACGLVLYAASLFGQVAAIKEINEISNLRLPVGPCDPNSISCPPYTGIARYDIYGIISVVNGGDRIDVSQMSNPMNPSPLWRGCLAESRSIGVYQDVIYSVNDRSTVCGCAPNANCTSRSIKMRRGSTTKQYGVAEVPGLRALNTTEAISAQAQYLGDSVDACQPLSTNLTGKIALVNRGGCPIATKASNLQLANAAAALIINSRPDVIMTTIGALPKTGLPGYLIASNDADYLKGYAGRYPILLDDAFVEAEDHTISNTPAGLTIVSVKNASEPSYISMVDRFYYANGLRVDSVRALLYVWGGYGATGSRSIFVFNISSPTKPKRIADYNQLPVSALQFSTAPDSSNLMWAVSRGTTVLVFNVTNLAVTSGPKVFLENFFIANFTTPGAITVLASSQDGRALYVNQNLPDSLVTVYNVSSLDYPSVSNVSVITSLMLDNATVVNDLVAREDYLWVATNIGLCLFYIGRPFTPERQSCYSTFDTSARPNEINGAWSIFPINRGQVFVAGPSSGFWVLEINGYGDMSETWFWLILFLVAIGVPLVMAFIIIRMRKRAASYTEQKDVVEGDL